MGSVTGLATSAYGCPRQALEKPPPKPHLIEATRQKNRSRRWQAAGGAVQDQIEDNVMDAVLAARARLAAAA